MIGFVGLLREPRSLLSFFAKTQLGKRFFTVGLVVVAAAWLVVWTLARLLIQPTSIIGVGVHQKTATDSSDHIFGARTAMQFSNMLLMLNGGFHLRV